MASIERSFAKLIGRQPSEAEVKNLYRVRDALGLKENDALWLVLIALESYDALYRKYPEMISAQVQKSVEAQRDAIAAIAEQETRRAFGTLADAVGRASEAVATRAMKASMMQCIALLALALLAFGSYCAAMGFVLGSGRLPWWAMPVEGQGLAGLFFSTLAKTPAGWIAVIVGAVGAIGALWHARKEIALHRRADLILASGLLVAIAGSFFWQVL